MIKDVATKTEKIINDNWVVDKFKVNLQKSQALLKFDRKNFFTLNAPRLKSKFLMHVIMLPMSFCKADYFI
jgi:hypothetical protein